MEYCSFLLQFAGEGMAKKEVFLGGRLGRRL
jgi:hypothetical protein